MKLMKMSMLLAILMLFSVAVTAQDDDATKKDVVKKEKVKEKEKEDPYVAAKNKAIKNCKAEGLSDTQLDECVAKALKDFHHH